MVKKNPSRGYAKYLIQKFGLKLKISYDKSKPNGTPRKILDSSLARKYGWKPKVDIDKGFNNIIKSLQS